MSDAELERLRGRIDEVNERILVALNERARLAREIGTLKVGQAYRPEREAQFLRLIKEANRGPLSDETVAVLFREIMSACLALERPITVAYLGPRGTFSGCSRARQDDMISRNSRAISSLPSGPWLRSMMCLSTQASRSGR